MAARAVPSVPDYVADAKTPKVGDVPTKKLWRFGFRFWGQMENFGLSSQDPEWFVSLLERLRELSTEEEDCLSRQSGKRDFYHYHAINWNQPGIPIRRSDLDWLPPEYRDNEHDYPMYQFTVSAALGRVAGFHDENQIFQIVLLDPQHNLQPVKRFDYRVDANWPVGNVHERMLHNIRALKEAKCADAACPFPPQIQAIETDFQPRCAVYIPDAVLGDALELLEKGQIKSLEELFEINVIEKTPPATT